MGLLECSGGTSGVVSQSRVTSFWNDSFAFRSGFLLNLGALCCFVGLPLLTHSFVRTSLWLEFSPAEWSVETFWTLPRHCRRQIVWSSWTRSPVGLSWVHFCSQVFCFQVCGKHRSYRLRSPKRSSSLLSSSVGLKGQACCPATRPSSS